MGRRAERGAVESVIGGPEREVITGIPLVV